MSPSAQLFVAMLGPNHTHNLENFILRSLESAIRPRCGLIDRVSPIVELLPIPSAIAVKRMGIYKELPIFVSQRVLKGRPSLVLSVLRTLLFAENKWLVYRRHRVYVRFRLTPTNEHDGRSCARRRC